MDRFQLPTPVVIVLIALTAMAQYIWLQSL